MRRSVEGEALLTMRRAQHAQLSEEGVSAAKDLLDHRAEHDTRLAQRLRDGRLEGELHVEASVASEHRPEDLSEGDGRREKACEKAMEGGRRG